MNLNPDQLYAVANSTMKSGGQRKFIDFFSSTDALEIELPADTSPPRDIAELRAMIAQRRVRVSLKLQRVLEYTIKNPVDVAFFNAQNIARNCAASNATVA